MKLDQNAERASEREAHPKQHELLLQAALAGDVDPHDPRLAARLAQCADCRALHDELIATRGLLDEAGRDEREILASLDRERVVPGSDRVAPLLRALAASTPQRELAPESELVDHPVQGPQHDFVQEPRRASSRARLAGVASAAAGIAAVGWLVRMLLPQDSAPQREVVLGSETDSGMTPRGPVREYSPLLWKLALPPGGRYELNIWDDGADAPPEPLFTLDKWYEPARIFAPEETRQWPDRIRWRVRVFDATDTQIDARTEFAQRSPR